MARTTQSEQHLTIGLDIGYGVVKAVTSDQTLFFPSVMGYAREIKFQAEQLTRLYPGDQLQDDDGQWFMGELAVTQLPPGELLRLRGRTADEANIGNAFRRRLAKAVIGKLLRGRKDDSIVHIRLSVGLPVDHMRDSADLKQALLGQHVIQTDTASLIANVTEVMVMPQPYGTIYAHLLTPTGELNTRHTYLRTGVCDVGTYTVDLTLDDDGQYVDADSGSVESGVYTAQERIAALLEQRYRQKMPYRVIEQVLRTGEFRAHGNPVDMRAEVEEALGPLRGATLNLLSEKWQSGANVDVIYLCGGGAYFVKDAVLDAYQQAQMVEDAQLANARGYLHYALFRQNQKA